MDQDGPVSQQERERELSRVDSGMLWTIALFAMFALLNFIALFPAVAEWRARRDAQPLKVVREYDGDVRFFAYRFAGFVDRNFGILLLRCQKEKNGRDGTLPDGQSFHIAPANGRALLSDAERSERIVKRMILGSGHLVLDNELRFEREIYANGAINGGTGNIYCALLSTGNIMLGEKSVVLRWSHAEGTFVGGEGCMYFGRVSSERTMVLGPQSSFTRLHAPVIEFGKGAERLARSFGLSELLAKDLPRVYDMRGRRTLVKGDIVIPPHTRIDGDLVATGRVHVGENAWVAGNVKGGNGIYVEAGAWIDGALISGKALHAESASWIKGPIIAERHVKIGRNCRLGSPEKPTTVTAEAILVACGVTAYGSVRARATGRVGDG